MAGPTTTGLAALIDGEDWHYVGETDEPAFENSWENVGSVGIPKMAFRIRESGIVDIQGTITSGSSASAAFTLPEGYRPAHQTYIPIVGSATPVAAYLLITTGGAVIPNFASGGTVIVYAQMFLNPPETP